MANEKLAGGKRLLIKFDFCEGVIAFPIGRAV
jgi:hypothetical protein